METRPLELLSLFSCQLYVYDRRTDMCLIEFVLTYVHYLPSLVDLWNFKGLSGDCFASSKSQSSPSNALREVPPKHFFYLSLNLSLSLIFREGMLVSLVGP